MYGPVEQVKLFRQIAIWTQLDQRRAARFSCIEDIENHRFAVQTTDFFYLPIKTEDLAFFERLFAERFIEVDFLERKWFDSVEEAIAGHLEEFRATGISSDSPN